MSHPRSALRLSRRWMPLAGIALLALQVGWVLHARWAPESGPELTPTAGRTSYHVHVSIDGRTLSDLEIRERYHIAERDRVGLSPALLQSIIRRVEEHHQRAGGPQVWVRLHTRHNGGEPQIWLWPEE